MILVWSGRYVYSLSVVTFPLRSVTFPRHLGSINESLKSAQIGTIGCNPIAEKTSASFSLQVTLIYAITLSFQLTWCDWLAGWLLTMFIQPTTFVRAFNLFRVGLCRSYADFGGLCAAAHCQINGHRDTDDGV